MRVLLLWLDGFDIETAKRFGLPTIDRLWHGSARARLDSGTTYLTGLTGEQLVNGLRPADGGRLSAVTFDPATYRVSQRNASLQPALGGTDTVVFDACYCDLARTPANVRGVIDWGAHDPGGPPQDRPAGLRDEIVERFGEYPATPFIYGCPWPSSDRCTEMGRRLVHAVETRRQISRWLLTERLPQWSLAFVGVSEAHSAVEGLHHGADPEHPLAALPSAPAAGAALIDVFRAIDDLVADLVTAVPDATVITFTTHGMGPNNSDVASMVLLGELLARWSGRRTPDLAWPRVVQGLPQLEPEASWSESVWGALNDGDAADGRRSARRLPTRAGQRIRARRRRTTAAGVDWMPLTRHQHRWPSMRAFALPSFYDGRVRVNLRGREASGCVDRGSYDDVLDEIETVLRSCRDPRTGEPLVSSLERPLTDPLAANGDEADLVVHWHGLPLGVEHPDLGCIGPIPPRRTGGHTSPHGAAFITGPGITPVDLGERSAFDILPTAFELTGSASPWQLSGEAITVPRAR